MERTTSKFITVHDSLNNRIIVINVNQIVYVSESLFHESCSVIKTTTSEFYVKDDLSEIMYEIC